MNIKIPNSIKLLLVSSCIYASFLLAYCLLVEPSNAQQKSSLQTGEKLFKKNCSGCHLNGQNLIKTEKPIVGSKKLLSKAIFKDFIENPPLPMPKFKNLTSNSEQLDELYRYVTSLKSK